MVGHLSTSPSTFMLLRTTNQWHAAHGIQPCFAFRLFAVFCTSMSRIDPDKRQPRVQPAPSARRWIIMRRPPPSPS
ncbi:hypothetical protein CKAH01_12270 [Colletotrichum kahawae]|uniref:Uncharacterized protein n=1 Tax=Colletotrichum kahawae TaxID=34407 RepID=A0AAD9YUW9_COLKA|nr:hypothetical protein CKAH01_12270 [Colletotrichum kahawae]